MDGPEGTAQLVAAWLRTRIPARLRIVETRLELAAGSLPDPARVLTEERGPIALEDWPSVYVLPQKLDRMDLVDLRGDGTETYSCRYNVRVLAWVRGDSYEGTDRLRSRYLLAIREALLERKQLRAAPAYGSAEWGTLVGSIAVDPSSFREDYGPIVIDEGRTIAGAFVDLAVLNAERTEVPEPMGSVEVIGVDTATLPPHPGL